jgi:hypothetical protein
MRFNVPHITRPLQLAEYAPEYGDASIQVWVNPPRAQVMEYYSLFREARAPDAIEHVDALDKRLTAWLLAEWGADWTAAEIEELKAGLMDTDPQMWGWLVGSTMRMIMEHRSAAKNA